MAIKHSFKVAASEGATQHDVSVSIPSYGEMTEKQRENLVAEGIRSVTIKVQGTLRRRLGKGVRGEALNREGQSAFDAAINGTRASTSGTVLDATALKLTREQIDMMTAAGATVINIPAELAGK